MGNNIVIYLKPGEIYASCDDIVIKTVLGSCISVCLHDKINRVGGANHYMLPTSKSGSQDIYNYGENAIPALIDAVISEGGNRKYLVSQIIGGSCTRPDSTIDVGSQNIEIARQQLAKYGIPILREEVGGTTGRVIRFFPKSNELEMKFAGVRAEKAESKPMETQPNYSFVNLSQAQGQFLQNLFSVALQRAGISLSSLLGTGVSVGIREVLLRKMDYVQEYLQNSFGDFIISTGQKEDRPLGEVVMLMDTSKARIIVNSLLKRPMESPLIYDRMESSVLSELANILINAILGTLANHLGFTMMLRVPSLAKGKAELEKVPFMNPAKKWKVSLAVKTSLSIPAFKSETSLLFMIELRTPSVFFDLQG
ncbi:MAG: hypothetical protein HUU50_14475 [Candidatus Brocadiae bacterium]|nr:hypothetical protein [Candidatus Brocadiia bacterium]